MLNKKYIPVILFFLLSWPGVNSQEPIDIWNIDDKKNTEITFQNESIENDTTQNSIYKMQSKNNIDQSIEEDQTLLLNKIVGLYDPAENGLDINMWSKSNGDQILNIFKRINKINLSKMLQKF